jgi:hypothetical protein
VVFRLVSLARASPLDADSQRDGATPARPFQGVHPTERGEVDQEKGKWAWALHARVSKATR